MMEKKFRYKKAFLFSIDALSAVTVLFLFFIAGVFYVAKANEDPLPELHTIRVCADVTALLDYQGTLASLSQENISISMRTLLPVQYEMALKLDCSGKDPLTIETSEEAPINGFIVSGRRVFLAQGLVPCIAEYQIWLH